MGHTLSHFYGLCLAPLFIVWQREFGVSFAELGLAIVVMSIMSATLQTPIGFLVDRYGARSFLIGGTLLMSLAISGMAFATHYWQIVALATISGAGNAVFHPSDYSILAGSVAKERIGRSFALHSFTGNLGFAAAPPVVAGLMLFMGWREALFIIGLFGLLVVIVISVSFLTTRGVGTAGIPPGKRLHLFAAPLAASTLNGAVNLNPPCTLAQHDPRALNVCLLVKRAPLVLGLFVTASRGCERQVDAMQTVSGLFPPNQVQFAAVAIRASHAAALAAVRAHHWTIRVAYDLDGRLGATYGVEVCPIVELA